MVSDWPLYFKDRLITDNLNSNVGIATLWMPKESVVSELRPGSFSVCGQLYTKRGINPLFRNILANPRIRYLVICGVDRQGSGEALLKFSKNGFYKQEQSGNLKGWRIIDDEETLLDKEISEEALTLLRENVEVFDLRERPLSEVADFVASLEGKEVFGDPQVFPDPEKSESRNYPSDLSVFKIRKDYISEAWLDALKVINRFGLEVPGMYGKVKEVHNLSIIIEKEDMASPKLESFLKFGKEGLDKYLTGFFDKNEAGNSSYTYGERIMNWDGIDQLDLMVQKLRRFSSDRGALAVLWKPHLDNFPPTSTKITQNGQTKGWQVPCLVMILGQCLNDRLNLTAVFRNNDIYGGWPLNAFALRNLQQKIAKEIGKELGTLTTISHIAEIYEMDWEDSQAIVEQNDSLGRTCTYDTRSYYTIRIEGEEIIVTYMTPDGSEKITEHKINGKAPKAARDLCAMAMKEMLVSELGAAMDLGRQLAKAETAVKLGLRFEQDHPLKAF